MTQFEQLRIIYNQFFNLTDEIKLMIEKEEYNEAISKLQYKDTLIEKFALTKKTVTLNEAEKQEMAVIEAKLKEKEASNLKFLKGLHSEVAAELKKTNSTLKMNNAYSKKDLQQRGSMLDISE